MGVRSETFQMVFLCTGNRLRSPVAEAFVREATKGLPVSVRSVGLLELGAVAALPEAVVFGRSHGIDLTGHRAKELRGTQLVDTDLVLGFEREHVVRAVVDARAGRARAFLLAELVDLLDDAPPPAGDDLVASARHAVAVAAKRRGTHLPSSRHEIADPLGRPPAQQEQILQSVADLTSLLVERLFGR